MRYKNYSVAGNRHKDGALSRKIHKAGWQRQEGSDNSVVTTKVDNTRRTMIGVTFDLPPAKYPDKSVCRSTEVVEKNEGDGFSVYSGAMESGGLEVPSYKSK